MFARARALEPFLEDAIHSLRHELNVIDIPNFGLAAAVELAPLPGQASVRAMKVFEHCFDAGVMVRYSSDIIALGPAACASADDIGIMVDTLRRALRANA